MVSRAVALVSERMRRQTATIQREKSKDLGFSRSMNSML